MMKTLTDKIIDRLGIGKRTIEKVVLLLSDKYFAHLQNIYTGSIAIYDSFTS